MRIQRRRTYGGVEQLGRREEQGLVCGGEEVRIGDAVLVGRLEGGKEERVARILEGSQRLGAALIEDYLESKGRRRRGSSLWGEIAQMSSRSRQVGEWVVRRVD